MCLLTTTFCIIVEELIVRPINLSAMNIYLKATTLVVITLFFFASCASDSSYEKAERTFDTADYEEEANMEFELADKSTSSPSDNDNAFISSSAAAFSSDTTRKLIRTAEMKFRVKNVRNASINIENIIQDFDGFVTSTHLESNIDRKEKIQVSADSSLETVYYSVSNNITFRVPVEKLDTTLRTIAELIDFLDYRRINANDVTFQLLLNKMAEKRLGKHTTRIEDAIDEQGKKLKHTSSAEDQLLSREEMRDRAKIKTLEIFDEIDFSTVHLKIYQRQVLKRTVLENDKNIDAYKPGLWSEIKDALSAGWHILKSIFIALVSIWPLLFLGIAAYFIFIKFFRQTKTEE
jgi:hypothetical protein